MNSNDLVICTERLSKSFGEVHALKSLDLGVPQKSIFAFLGPNGAGKTTTIKLLLGLLKPSSGGGKIVQSPVAKFIGAIQDRLLAQLEAQAGDLLLLVGDAPAVVATVLGRFR